MIKFFSVFLCVSAGLTVIAQPNDSVDSSHKMKILSWNIYMLPGFLGKGKVPRAEAIGELLKTSDYDVLVFQEAFHKRSVKTLSRHLLPAFSFKAGPANKKFLPFKTNSGLLIFSKYPITHFESIIFQTRQGVDAFSRKGALLVELNAKNHVVQVVGTHLQNSGNIWLRQSQCVELYYRLLQKYEQLTVPQIICGDFNINRHNPEDGYEAMLNTLNAVDHHNPVNSFSYDREQNDLQIEEGDKKDLIDYILVRKNMTSMELQESKIKIIQCQWNKRYQDLSDHYSLESEIIFHPKVQFYSITLEN